MRLPDPGSKDGHHINEISAPPEPLIQSHLASNGDEHQHVVIRSHFQLDIYAVHVPLKLERSIRTWRNHRLWYSRVLEHRRQQAHGLVQYGVGGWDTTVRIPVLW